MRFYVYRKMTDVYAFDLNEFRNLIIIWLALFCFSSFFFCSTSDRDHKCLSFWVTIYLAKIINKNVEREQDSNDNGNDNDNDNNQNHKKEYRNKISAS